MNHSFIQMESNQVLVEQYIKYQNTDNRGKPIKIYNIVEVQHNVEPFKKGELILTVTGENWCQKKIRTIEQQLDISGAVSIVPLHSPLYYHFAKGYLNGFLKKNFEIVHLEEILENKEKYKL